ncbi:hypothetical protein [Mycolicibacterium pulveris]|uniref:hypothetical protein n=1 Tax=Mycolicibacterium pulveris TaxID=36813 RepID=UPI003CEA165B
MLSAIAIVPSAPVLVPELAAGAAAELAELRQAALTAAGALPARWVAVGVDRADGVVAPDRRGTFAGYGVDVRVALGPAVDAEPAWLPLCALVTGWLRGQVNPDARVEVRVYADTHDADTALGAGRALRAEIDQASEPVGVLVVADGAHTLTASAPGGHDPESIPAQEALDDALAAGDAAALTRLRDGPVGRVGYQVLAGLTQTGPTTATELYRGAPYGVGYFVGIWHP